MATVDVDIHKLLEAGAHFGHKTSRWHPKMAPYIHSKRGGSHIIDLTKTVEGLEIALAFITKTVASGRQVLVVGTKRQSKDVVRALADATSMPFVTERWLGGMMTNQKTISARIKHLKDLESRMSSGELANRYNKLEVQRFQEEIDAMNVKFGGIKDMNGRPGAMIVFDMVHEANAVKEAHKLNLPIVGLVDTNADPSEAAYPIPSNDDAVKTLQLMSDYFQAAIEAGKQGRKGEAKPDKDEAKSEVPALYKTKESEKAEAEKAAKTDKEEKPAEQEVVKAVK